MLTRDKKRRRGRFLAYKKPFDREYLESRNGKSQRYVSIRAQHQLLVQIHPLGASGHMGEILRFVPFLFIYLYLFSGTGVQVRPVDGFLRAIAH